VARLEVQYCWYEARRDVVVLEIVDRDAPAVEKQHFNPLGEGVVAKVTVAFADGVDRPVDVRITTNDGLTPTALQRFPWGRWLATADAERRGDEIARWEALGVKLTTEPRRPGRKGHDRAHYEAVAKQYLELRAQGVEAPAKIIARRGSYNQNTVRGWIRQCRELELLPPGRPGRAG